MTDSNKMKKALVVQGGGLRGIYSMAALMALEELGLSQSFDHIFGSSAGAINGAYMLANQAKMAVTVYLDDISNKKFVSYTRYPKIVDIDYLVDGVLKRHKKLDVEAVRNSQSILHIILTDYNTGKPYILTNKENDYDFMEAMRATSALPLLYNKVIRIRGKGFIDGGVVDSIPFMRAVEQGCNDITVVLTKPLGSRRNEPNSFFKAIGKFLIKSYPSPLQNIMFEEDDLFNHTMATLEGLPESLPAINVKVISPSDTNQMVGRTTNDRNLLLKCALMGRNDTRIAFGMEPASDNPF